MSGDRRSQIAERLLAAGSDAGPKGASLSRVAAEVLQLPGAAIMLAADDGTYVSVGNSGGVIAEIEELQRTLGEGPCVDAYELHRPVLEPDLARSGALRWVAFAGPALAVGARAVFGFPLGVGPAPIGSLNLYSEDVGVLTEGQHADALAVAAGITASIVALQAGAPDGVLAPELDDISHLQLQVHQATGMVAVQLGVPVDQALVRLRAQAYGTGRPIAEVAADIVARRLRLEP
ncbi:MAG: GAF and ANTAR domain-containing protein [Acidimicrobiales bacterium]